MEFHLAFTWVQRFPNERYITTLMKRAEESTLEVAAIAAFALGTLRAQAAEPVLSRLLLHRSANVRNLPASALSELDYIDPSHGAVEHLVQLLNDENDMVRISAIEALATAQSTTAVAPLVALLLRSRPGIQLHVVNTLGTLGDRSALGALHTLRSQLAAQPPLPERGGTRGSDPPPQRLLAAVEEAIGRIEL